MMVWLEDKIFANFDKVHTKIHSMVELRAMPRFVNGPVPLVTDGSLITYIKGELWWDDTNG